MLDNNTTKSRVDRYELDELLEEGLTGSLYRATDTESGRRVLLKMVASTVGANPVFQRYFYEKKAQCAAQIEHPNVLQPVGVGQEGDTYFVAVPDVNGQRLSEMLREAPLPFETVMDILRQVAEGLRTAHRNETVHGHLKPADVIVTEDNLGRRLVKVVFCDLGVAPEESLVSVFGEVTGTPKYMAPEVIRGRARTPESDIFSLGVIAYELLTGSEPFPSDHALGYLFANCQHDHVSADDALDSVPHELSLVVDRMLAKTAADRYRSVQRIIDDLDRCAESIRTGRVEMVPYGTDSAFARTYELPEPKAKKREKKAFSASTLVAVVLALVIVGLLVDRFRSDRVQQPGGTARRPASPEGGAASRPGAGRGGDVASRPGAAASAPTADPSAAKDAYERAARQWESVYSRQGLQGYELAVAGFSTVAERYPESVYGARAREQIGQIYTTWAQTAMAKGDFSEAVEKYQLALDYAPENSQYAELARRKLPLAMASQAEAAEKRGLYSQALQMYDKTAERFPSSMQAELAKQRRPRLLLNMAYKRWQEDKDYDGALTMLEDIIADYPDTEEAAHAKEALPAVHLQAIEETWEEGDLAEARRQLQQLAAAYPQHDASAQAADLDARLLLGLYQQAARTAQSEEAAAYFGELYSLYPGSRWTVEALRDRLGLKADGTSFDTSAAQDQIRRAKGLHQSGDYANACEVLRGVLRFARPESAPAAEAAALLPEWLFESAVDRYGRDQRADCEDLLGQLGDQFAGTEWEAKATATLESMQRPPAGMVYVPAGRFEMGTSMNDITGLVRQYGMLAGDPDEESTRFHAELYGLLNETPRHTATTGAFYIDRTEVTNEQYKEFIDATGYAAPLTWEGGSYPEGHETYPVVGVRLEDAQAYAEWAGKRLPTEAEWEKAARGVDGRRYPWGPLFDPKRSQHMRPEADGPVPVGSFPSYDSPYGCQDMIGNVMEWTSSTFRYYENTESTEEQPDTDARVVRGGAWYQESIVPVPFRCATRAALDPTRAYAMVGFRCVKDAPTGPTAANAEGAN